MPRPALTWASFLLIAATSGAVPAHGQSTPAAAPAKAEPASDRDLRKLDEWMTTLRTRNAERYAITSQKGIDEARYVKIGGIDQWIHIRGQDRANPVILLIHGGPGDVTNPWSYALFGEWEASYTVVQWDQRGGGRTLHRTGDAIASTMTIDRMVQDGLELTQLLLKDLHKNKLIIVGHSWGSTLGALMAKARPELFHAFIGTGQVANTARGNVVGYEAVLARARALGHTRAVAELTAIGPPPYPDYKGWPVLRKWGSRFEGSDRFIGGTLGFALAAPGYTPADVTDWIEGQNVSGRALFEQIMALDPRSFGGEFKVPVFVIQGAHDFNTPTELAREYVASIKAPKKAFVTIPDAGHFAVFMKPEAFLAEMTKRLQPLTGGKEN